jgi:ApaG protein
VSHIPTIRWDPIDPVEPRSESITNGVRVVTESFFVPERSDPQNNRYFFAYRIRITNEGAERVQLLSRRWLITDGNGLTQVVEGEGVVGEQPALEPGEAFEYASVCPLGTRMGFMRGRYTMQGAHGHRWHARIHEFALLTPGLTN